MLLALWFPFVSFFISLAPCWLPLALTPPLAIPPLPATIPDTIPEGPKDGPMGPLWAILQPFRMASHFEWMAILKGKPLRMDSNFKWQANPNGGRDKRPNCAQDAWGVGLLVPLCLFWRLPEWEAIPKVKSFRSHSDQNYSVVIRSGM